MDEDRQCSDPRDRYHGRDCLGVRRGKAVVSAEVGTAVAEMDRVTQQERLAGGRVRRRGGAGNKPAV
ncbi:hypothetical protein KCP74_01715 [Salmonella enterica subsp. enterica]|nr:hypothetical protein KCP74_01715 [Salmonella enterica subsp. enterica]